MAITVERLSGVKSTSSSLSADLALRVKEDILAGKLKTDQKLTEQTICDKYKVSRTPVREALVKLEMEGLIESIPNRGSFVVGLSEQDLEDVFVLRKMYEIQATKWAIERITEEELDELEENMEFMEFYTMKNDLEKMLNINRNFHKIIYNASHNHMLINLLSSYQTYVKHTQKAYAKDKSYLEDLLNEHRKIFAAFEKKDVAAGAKAMREHMDNTIARYKK